MTFEHGTVQTYKNNEFITQNSKCKLVFNLRKNCFQKTVGMQTFQLSLLISRLRAQFVRVHYGHDIVVSAMDLHVAGAGFDIRQWSTCPGLTKPCILLRSVIKYQLRLGVKSPQNNPPHEFSQGCFHGRFNHPSAHALSVVTQAAVISCVRVVIKKLWTSCTVD
jgi:hypothetical protein